MSSTFPGLVELSRVKSNLNEKSAFAKATADADRLRAFGATAIAVEPSRIKSNSFMKGMKQIEEFIEDDIGS